jgi:signal recognition particle GTPase
LCRLGGLLATLKDDSYLREEELVMLRIQLTNKSARVNALESTVHRLESQVKLLRVKKEKERLADCSRERIQTGLIGHDVEVNVIEDELEPLEDRVVLTTDVSQRSM